MVEKSVIHECDFKFKCPMYWEELLILDDPDKRYCTECQREVFYIRTREELEEQRQLGHCIAASVNTWGLGLMRIITGGIGPWEKPGVRYEKLLILGDERDRNELRIALRELEKKK
ncbi:MAG TPA: hypothetical protein PLB32_06905 [Acidobacteriota bacterium]|nr:hypothetical protein [Acidobacteriota bacterium]HNB70973.1 hypothetical protein [Acidobacteriota bacterium]HNG92507.1 hypothetical protein [Acidobacteriota bacterium]